MKNQVKSFIDVLKVNKPLRLLLMAIALAILAAFLAIQYLNLREKALREAYFKPGEKTVSVIVARQDLGAGAVINGQTMAAREIPGEYVHRQAIPPSQFQQIEGRRLLEPLSAGKPLLWSHVTTTQRRDFSDLLDSGRRAVTVLVDQINSINGMVEPGNHIDLYVSLSSKLAGSSEDGDVVFPILQNVQVMATGNRLDPKVQATMQVAYVNKGSGYNAVTVNLTPEESALLFAARNAGRLIATLRNRDDKAFVFSSVKPTDILAMAQKINAKNQNLVQVIRDENGNIIGKVVNGQAVDSNGNVIGRVNADGSIVDDSGRTIGQVSKEAVQEAVVVRDKEGNIIGKVVDGKVVDENGVVIGTVNEDGTVTDANGNTIGLAKREIVTEEIANKLGIERIDPADAATVLLVDYLVGGNSKNGIAVVEKMTIQ